MNNTFLKWAGGKNWFVKHQAYHLPKKYNNYIEPFLGGGSTYFYMEPNRVLNVKLNDACILTLFKVIYPSILQNSQCY